MNPLTDRQREALDFFRNYLAEHGFSPTLREIVAQLRITGALGAMRHSESLEKKVLPT